MNDIMARLSAAGDMKEPRMRAWWLETVRHDDAKARRKLKVGPRRTKQR
jgi:hypothetical protein